MPGEPDLPGLVRGVGRGDKLAFGQLYDLFAAQVYGLCLAILKDSGAAEDATQRSFLKLWTRSHTYKPVRGSFRTWLMTIARREAIDAYRSRRRRNDRAVQDAEGLLDQIADPNSQGEEERWRSLRLGLANLPEDQRSSIVLAFYFGLSHSESAGYLQVPLGTVKTRLRLGMEKLRKVWTAGEPPSPQGSDSAPNSVRLGRSRARNG